jgi:hypothetical protein
MIAQSWGRKPAARDRSARNCHCEGNPACPEPSLEPRELRLIEPRRTRPLRQGRCPFPFARGISPALDQYLRVIRPTPPSNDPPHPLFRRPPGMRNENKRISFRWLPPSWLTGMTSATDRVRRINLSLAEPGQKPPFTGSHQMEPIFVMVLCCITGWMLSVPIVRYLRA